MKLPLTADVPEIAKRLLIRLVNGMSGGRLLWDTGHPTESLAGLNRARLLDLADQASSSKQLLVIFDVLLRLQNFRSASVVGRRLEMSALTLREKMTLVRCLLSTSDGVEADRLARSLIEAGDVVRHTRSELVALAATVVDCGFPVSEKLAFLDRIGGAIKKKKMDPEASGYFDFIRYKCALLSDSAPDPLDYVGGNRMAELTKSNKIRFIEPLLSYGHIDDAYATLDELSATSGPRDYAVFLANYKHRPDWLEERVERVEGVPNAYFRERTLLSVAAGRRWASLLGAAIFEKCYEVQRLRYGSAHAIERDAILRILLATDCTEELDSLIRSEPLPDTVLTACTTLGYRYFENGDYRAAKDAFLTVLEECPGDRHAAAGLGFVLPRTGRTVTEILKVRDRIGYGLRGQGRTGIVKNESEYIWAMLSSGAYVQGSYAKRDHKQWRIMSAAFRERFLNYALLPDDIDGKSLFVIADEGVGDEIRTAQFYGALSRRCRRLTITCDPRLESLLRRSYPKIRFVPVVRFRAGVRENSNRTERRLFGFNSKIANYLREDNRRDLDESDYITFGQNLFFNYFCGALDRPPPGAYLMKPNATSDCKQSNVLRVGLLWRSHLRRRQRRHLYLEVDDFLPLTKLKGVELWSIQHCMDEYERKFCERHGIRIIKDVDLYNDFEGFSEHLAGLDRLIGISSVPIELGAALGTRAWMLGFSPENYYLRTAGGTTEADQFTLNSEIIAPRWIDFSDSREACVRVVMDEVCRRLLDTTVAPMVRSL